MLVPYLEIESMKERSLRCLVWCRWKDS